MSARAIAIHGNEMSGERRANLEIKSECPALVLWYIYLNFILCVEIIAFVKMFAEVFVFAKSLQKV